MEKKILTQAEYLDIIKKEAGIQAVAAVLQAQEKYGANQWWLSNIPEVIGYYQLFEDTTLVRFSDFQLGVEKLLQRPVFTHEFATNRAQLQEHAKKAKDNLLTQEDISEGMRSSFETLESYANDHDIKVIGLTVGTKNA